MGTKMDYDDKAQKIKDEISKIGWSMNEFVFEYDKFYNYKSKLTCDSFKKQLARKTTRTSLLNNYLEFIYKHPTWIAHNDIRPTFINDELDDSFVLEMRQISAIITKKITQSK